MHVEKPKSAWYASWCNAGSENYKLQSLWFWKVHVTKTLCLRTVLSKSGTFAQLPGSKWSWSKYLKLFRVKVIRNYIKNKVFKTFSLKDFIMIWLKFYYLKCVKANPKLTLS